MIADSGVITSSRWSNEVWRDSSDYVYQDSTLLDLQGMDLDLTSLESEIERVYNHQQNERSTFDLGIDSRGTSVASSECSDELALDIDYHLEDMLFSSNPVEAQFLSTSLHSLLDFTGDITGTLEWSDYDLSEECSESDKHSSIENKPSTSHCSQHRKITKTWSEFSDEEQIEKVEEISRVISNDLGLREQLEVIRLINPDADVSPTDKEFVIDLESINEEKLEKIENFIKLHIEDNNSSDHSSAHSHSSQKKPTKKLCKDRKTQHKAARQRQRKEYRQMMKEKRSGLFVKEEVMALSVCEPIEEDEVDILA